MVYLKINTRRSFLSGSLDSGTVHKTLIVILFFFSAFLVACDKKTIKDIKVEKIERACDLLDAYEIFYSDYANFLEKKLDEWEETKKLSPQQKKDFEEDIAKYNKIARSLIRVQFEGNWTDSDFKECDNGGNRVERLAKYQKKIADYIEDIDDLTSTDALSVATKYLNALKNAEITKAKKFGTQQTQNMLDSLSVINKLPELLEVKDITCVEMGDSATCTYCCNNGKNTEVHLIKEGDRWWVNEKAKAPKLRKKKRKK